MNRVSMPSGQAGMQLPLPLHTEAQRTAAAEPAPPVIRSMMPAVVSSGPASPSPAGATIGHARKHAPQRVHASAIASPRALKSSRYLVAPASINRSALLTPGVVYPKVQRMHHRTYCPQDFVLPRL